MKKQRNGTRRCATRASQSGCCQWTEEGKVARCPKEQYAAVIGKVIFGEGDEAVVDGGPWTSESERSTLSDSTCTSAHIDWGHRSPSKHRERHALPRTWMPNDQGGLRKVAGAACSGAKSRPSGGGNRCVTRRQKNLESPNAEGEVIPIPWAMRRMWSWRDASLRRRGHDGPARVVALRGLHPASCKASHRGAR